MNRFWEIIEQSVPLLFLLGMIVLVFKLYERRKTSKFSRSGVDRLDAMDDERFALFIAELFDRLGYVVERSAPSGGGTAAFLLRRSGRRTAAFAIRTGRQVGLRELQEVISAKKTFDCAEGILVTNSTFNYPVKAVAHRESIELWDRAAVAERMIEVKI
jgi:HJR/Mrr/RecB family endonuclease